jgi:hypothetical protein
MAKGRTEYFAVISQVSLDRRHRSQCACSPSTIRPSKRGISLSTHMPGDQRAIDIDAHSISPLPTCSSQPRPFMRVRCDFDPFLDLERRDVTSHACTMHKFLVQCGQPQCCICSAQAVWSGPVAMVQRTVSI